MAATVMSSALSLKKTSSPLVDSRPAIKGLPSLARRSGAFKVEAKGKKIKVALPYGPGGGLVYKEGVDASGRKGKGKGLYQFADKYGANVDGYSPIYSPEEWSPSGDTYVGGQTGLLIWAVTLAGLLGGGALLVYSTSALSQ